MKIKSNFTDYYDFVANQFGGGDPRVVYNRVPFPSEHTADFKPVSFNIKDDSILQSLRDSVSFSFNSVWRNKAPVLAYKWIIIGGKGYLVVSDNSYDYTTPTTYQILNRSHCELSNVPTSKFEVMASRYVGFECPALLELHKKLNVPIFCISGFSMHSKEIQIEYNIPILQTYGFASLVAPQQMYQDISYFLANTIHGSPDIDVPVQLNNKEQIIKAGFDVKTSFRHPTI